MFSNPLACALAVASSDEILPQFFKQSVECLIIQTVCSSASQNNDIQLAEQLLMTPERFSNQSFDPISFTGKPNMFFCNNHTQSRSLMATIYGKNQQLGTGDFVIGLTEYCLEVRGSEKPQFPAKTLIGHWRLRSKLSGCQFCATTSATTLDNQTTTACSHSSTESMGSGALDQAGLEGSFHNGDPKKSLSGENQRARILDVFSILCKDCDRVITLPHPSLAQGFARHR